jgi:membrane associated rhomboid family serine protease
MLKAKKAAVAGLIVGIMSFVATPAFARSISLKDAGISLWIFIIIGAVIVLLQLIPALILFFSFIGTTSSLVFKRKKATEEEILLPGYEPAPVKK